jgi:hypothetical protein
MAVTIATLGERALRRLGVVVVPLADRPALSVIIPAVTLATSALVELGVIAADETPATLDAALALAKVAAVHDALVAQAFVSWSLDAVPQAVSEEMVKLTANVMASAFGKTAGDIQMHAALEARIRKVAQIMRAPDLATAAVMDVHRDLSARGLVRWSVFDVPDSAASAYVILAANQLAPEFGAKAGDGIAAERSLARYIALPTSGERVPAEYF